MIHPHFKRDVNSRALVSTDGVGLAAYKARKLQMQHLVNQINTFKTELDEIKILLKKLINKE